MKISAYTAPKWFLQHKLVQKYVDASKIPKYRLQLLDREQTKIENIDMIELGLIDAQKNNDYKLYVKRDDQTHEQVQTQGNKLRKLEFLFADALKNHKARHVITAGGLQSNHARAVAAVCRKLNLKSHLFLRSHTSRPNELNLNGNLLLDLMLDANVYLIEKNAQYVQAIEYKMKLLAEKLNEPSYLVPIGGSNLTGLFGYVEFFDEILSKQKADEFVDDIVVTTGSGGTMSAIAIANFLTGSRFKVHAFCVCDSSKYFYDHLTQMITDLFGVEVNLNAKDLVNIVQCSKGLGYAKSTVDEIKFIVGFFQRTGILLDPVYTGKTMYTLVNLLNGRKPHLDYENDVNAKNFASKLKGNRIMFVHTGGQLANFDNHKFDDYFGQVKPNIYDCFGDKIFTL